MTNEPLNPWAIDQPKFNALLDTIAECPEDCQCITCQFINLIPVMLDAEGVES